MLYSALPVDLPSQFSANFVLVQEGIYTFLFLPFLLLSQNFIKSTEIIGMEVYTKAKTLMTNPL